MIEQLLKMDISDWLTITAMIVGPILAVQVQKGIEQWKERRGNQLHVFRVLMATRATTLSADHVNALNMVGMFFSNKKKKEKPTISAWLSLLNQFANFPQEANFNDQNQYLIELNAASNRSREYLVKLLTEMSKTLDYDFEEAHIRTGCYIPLGHIEIENEQTLIRRGILELINGDRSLSTNISGFPDQKPDETVLNILKETSERQAESINMIKQITKGDLSLSVSILETNEQRKPLTGNKKAG